jgi:hypothetical protein
MSLLRAAIASEWTAYLPTFNTTNNDASLGNGSLSGRWRRNGDSADISVRLAWGSTTASGTGDFRFSLPIGLRVDPSRTPEGAFPTRLYSSVYLSDASTATNRRAGTIEAVSEFLFAVIPNGAANANATTPFTWTTSDNIQFSVLVPIKEFA